MRRTNLPMYLSKITHFVALFTFLFSIFGCKDFGMGVQEKTLILNDTLIVAYHDTLYNASGNIWVSFDSLAEDSRCPTNMDCSWEGAANVKITFNNAGDKKSFVLSTLYSPESGYFQDTTISNYKFSLVDVLPYPDGGKIVPENYKIKFCWTK
jgi:hypothetical protein